MSVLSHESSCECCSGLRNLTGQWSRTEPLNRAGLTRLRYSAGRHGEFRASMLARISQMTTLRQLGWRTNDDFSIALMDAWAIVLDVLSFYDERILQEAYLRTAVERRSLLELSRLVGYELRPGLAASTLLAFLLDGNPGSPPEVNIPAGTPAQSIPVKDELPQTFETSADLMARPRWNSIRPRLTSPQLLDKNAHRLFAAGLQTNLRPGDPVLLVTEQGNHQKFLRVKAVRTDAALDRTQLDFATTPQTPPGLAYRAPKALFASAGPATNVSAFAEIPAEQPVNATQAHSALLMAGFSTNQWVSALDFQRKQPAPPTGQSGLYALRQSVGIFGHNAPEKVPDGQTLKCNTEADGSIVNNSSIYLEQEVKGILEGGWVVLESEAVGTSIFQVTSVGTESLAKYGISGKATRLKLKPSSGLAGYTIRHTTVHLVSELLPLAAMPIDTLPAQTELLEVEDIVPDLAPGRKIILTGLRTGAMAGVPGAEALELLSVGQGEYTILRFKRPLQFGYIRNTVRLFANVAEATHGETHEEPIGSGDGSAIFQTMSPRSTPLTYVSSSDSPTGGESTLQVRVDGVLWHERTSLLDAGPDDRVYTVRLTDNGETRVGFGDGINGRRLPSGANNVTALYRSGIGSPGLVDSGRIELLPRKPLGVDSVTNPMPTSGAQDPETRDQARQRAPLTVRTLDRLVSLADFEDFASAFSGVAKARAEWIWAGNRRVIHLTVAAPGGAEFSSEVLANLVTAMSRSRVQHVPVTVAPFDRVFFTLSAKLKIHPDYREKEVLATAQSALREAFGFDARPFAGRVAASDVLAVLQRQTGVLAVDLDTLAYEAGGGGNAPDAFGLPVRGARYLQSSGKIQPAQLLLLSPSPALLGRMLDNV
ncbi:putative baseplate assembly protein [Bryobacterales bacterium F-183]|nr:putative baseplate assembly protein [Bryobacterales bacterium F-183]